MNLEKPKRKNKERNRLHIYQQETYSNRWIHNQQTQFREQSQINKAERRNRQDDSNTLIYRKM